MSASKLKLPALPVVFQKRNLNFASEFEDLWLDVKLLNLVFLLSKILFHSSWKIIQCSKKLCNDAPLIAQWLERNVLSPDAFGAMSSLSLLIGPFLFKEDLFFFYDFKTIEYLINLFISIAAPRVPFIIFIALMVSTS